MNEWHRIQECIRCSMSSESFCNWLEPVNFSHIDERKKIHLLAPNINVQKWLQTKYKSKIISAAQVLDLDINSVAIDLEDPQGTLPLEPRPTNHPLGTSQQHFNKKYTFDSFVAGSCNEFAYAACLAVSNDPGTAYNPLYLYSPVGMGKTHLLHAIGHRMMQTSTMTNIVYISAEEFMNEMIISIKNRNMRDFQERFRNADALLVDDIQVLGNKERTQEEFFHTFNALHTHGKQIVISGDTDPNHIPGLVNRLNSRFSWGLLANIQEPDLETKMAILDRKSKESNIALSVEVCTFLATTVNSNIRAMEGVLNRLNAHASFCKSTISLSMARKVIQSLGEESSGRASLQNIQFAVAQEFDLQVKDLISRNHAQSIVYPRQIAMYLCKRLTRFSLTDIASVFQKHHTTVLHSINKIEQRLEQDDNLQKIINKVVNKFETPGISKYL